MRIMAIDYGDARTGIAVSDMLGMIAGETFVITQWDPAVLADTIVREAKTRNVEKLVLGLPKNMDGTEGPRAEKARALAAMLEERDAPPVVMWDERRTTVEAHNILSQHNYHGQKRKNTVDAVAASLILEGYLNSLKR